MLMIWTFRPDTESATMFRESRVCHRQEFRSQVSMEVAFHSGIPVRTLDLLVTTLPTAQFTRSALRSRGFQAYFHLK